MLMLEKWNSKKRSAITDIYSTKESSHFGLSELSSGKDILPETSKLQKDLKKANLSVQQKVKEISQAFWAAVTSGRS